MCAYLMLAHFVISVTNSNQCLYVQVCIYVYTYTCINVKSNNKYVATWLHCGWKRTCMQSSNKCISNRFVCGLCFDAHHHSSVCCCNLPFDNMKWKVRPSARDARIRVMGNLHIIGSRHIGQKSFCGYTSTYVPRICSAMK